MPDINNGCIDVWTISIESTQHLIANCKELLSPDERIRAARFVTQHAGRRAAGKQQTPEQKASHERLHPARVTSY